MGRRPTSGRSVQINSRKMITERKIMLEMLSLYEDHPYLWDPKQEFYNNKEARDKAYDILLEKYKEFQHDATLIDVKRKIDNMRTTYRREHKKVLRSRLNGDDEEHIPKLWYYNYMTFLNDVSDFRNIESMPRSNDVEASPSDEYKEPARKRRRSSDEAKMSMSTIYLEDRQDSDEDDNVVDNLNDVQQSHHDQFSLDAVTEVEAFGTTVGLQLKELEPMQRVIAEKLISDVIFSARLNRLTVNSIIETNNPRYM